MNRTREKLYAKLSRKAHREEIPQFKTVTDHYSAVVRAINEAGGPTLADKLELGCRLAGGHLATMLNAALQDHSESEKDASADEKCDAILERASYWARESLILIQRRKKGDMSGG